MAWKIINLVRTGYATTVLQKWAQTTLTNKIIFIEAIQVILNNVSSHTHNQMVKALPHSTPSVFGLLYALKCMH
jgi:hypothetical protein